MRPKILLIIAACLPLLVGCDKSCTPLEAEKGESYAGARIKTDYVICIGSIDVQGVVFKVDGRILDNQLRGENRVGALVIPADMAIQDAANELSILSPPKDEPGQVVQLANQQGSACYGEMITEHYYGALTTTVYFPVGSLKPGENYKAYLIAASQKGVKAIGYSEEGKEVMIPTFQADIPVVSMQKADAKIDASKAERPTRLELEAQVNHKKAGDQGGFLIAKEGSDVSVVKNMVAHLIQQSQYLPSGTQLKPLDGYPDLLIASNIDLHFANQSGDLMFTISDHDEEKQLERGATYQVYAYVVDQHHNYIISPQAKSITIPKPDAQLTMQAVEIDNLVGNMTTAVIENLKLELKANITKHEGTNNPYLGFLFAQGEQVDAASALAKVKSLLSGTLTADSFNKQAGDIAYVAEQLHAGALGEQKLTVTAKDATKDMGLVLGEAYTVYCWIYDEQVIFMSEDAQVLRIPCVDGAVTFADTDSDITAQRNVKENHEVLFFEIDTNVTNPRYFEVDQAEMGHLYVLENHTLTVNHLQAVLDDCKARDEANRQAQEKGKKGPGDELNKPLRLAGFPDGSIGRVSKGHTAQFRKGITKHQPIFQEESKYQVYLWLRKGNSLFYSNPYQNLIETYKDYEDDETPKKIENDQIEANTDANIDIYYDVYIGKRRIVRVAVDKTSQAETSKFLNRNVPEDRAIIDKLLDKIIQKKPAAEKQRRIAEFIKHMPTS